MDLCKKNYLETVNRDIYILRRLMHKASDHTGNLDDQLVIEISQFLDIKLNEHGDLDKSHRCKKEKEQVDSLTEITPLFTKSTLK
ncbi:Spo0E family sporulation regulatory protein-aspartic acid phosphatase [Salibacterium salarium]|uniref:Spo0E family sporulation regulatory protein-aspartic acid phosphatase n=1 Tax=Salibacterium salarium TaxID=284579 RepID=UPI00163AAECD|nr:Spo0E family sporulation regulatory protein-aspartic acid phosphatase [Salibacterium salarium]